MLLLGLLLVPVAASGQSADVRDGVPMMRSTRARACPGPCRVLQRLRVGSARVQVLRQGRGRQSSVLLFVRVAGASYVQLLGASGDPAFGSDDPMTFHFDRVEALEIDGDPATPEIVALSGGRSDPSAVVCRLAPTPCCLFAMTAATNADGPVAPAADGRGHLLGGATGTITPRFCPAP